MSPPTPTTSSHSPTGARILDDGHRPPSPMINAPLPSTNPSLLPPAPRSPLHAPAASSASLPAKPPLSSTLSSSDVPSQRITLHLVSPFSYAAVPGQPSPPSRLNVKRTHTIHRVKEAVHEHWPGRPSIQGMRLIHSGRILNDGDTLSSLVADGQADVYIHLVVRPDAWTEVDKAPLTPSTALPPPIHAPTMPRTTSASGAATAPSPLLRPAVDPLEGSSYFSLPRTSSGIAASTASASAAPPSPDMHYQGQGLTVGQALSLERIPWFLKLLYSLYYHRYTVLYQRFHGVEMTQAQIDAGEGKVRVEVGLATQEEVDRMEQRIFGWPLWQTACANADVRTQLADCYERFQQVRSALLQLEEASREAFRQAARMHFPPPSLAVSPQPMPTAVPQPPQELAPIPLPRPGELASMFLPVLFLTIKLCILLYIFTRGASPLKRNVMYGITALWIAVEMFRAWRRRIRRLESARRRAARARRSPTTQRRTDVAAAAAGGAAPGVGQGSAQQPSGASVAGVPMAPQRHSVTSPAQPRFWLQRIAFLGMEEEDLNLGLRPSAAQAHTWMIRMTRERISQSRRQHGGLNLLARLDISKLLNDLTFPCVLYLTTLIPEVEELRAAEVRKRERLIKKWWASHGKDWVEAKRQALANASTDGGNDESTDDASRGHSELPRLLKHPYVLKLLQLKPTPDGLVGAIDGDSSDASASSSGRQIDIQEELDALRDAQRGAQRGGDGAVVAAGEEDPGVEEEEDQGEDAADDFGFF